MKTLLVGQCDLVLGKITTTPNGAWQFVPQDGTSEELEETVATVFQRVRRTYHVQTPTQFIALFFRGAGTPQEALLTSAWAKPALGPRLKTLLQQPGAEIAAAMTQVAHRRTERMAQRVQKHA